MSNSLIFNDLSIPFQTLQDCEKKIPQFFDILHLALDAQIEAILISETVGNNWFRLNYFDGFILSKWLDESGKDKSRYIKRVMDKSVFPLIQSETELKDFQLSFFKLKEKNIEAIALGAAVYLDTPAISFYSDELWKENSVSVISERIDDESVDVETKEHAVSNISLKSQVEAYIEKIKNERKNSKEYLKKLKSDGNTEFLNLIFCKKALDAFNNLEINEKLLVKIIDALTKLNSVILEATSDTDLILKAALTISTESDNTRNSSKLWAHRRIKKPDGVYYNFDLHIKNFPNGKRMYFYPDFDVKKIFIGYFGNHLPI